MVVASGGVEHAVEREELVAHADAGELRAGALGLGERGPLRAADQHERRDLRVAERADAGGVELALVLQAGQRTQAGDPGGVGVDEAGPRRGQREQPQRVTGRRGVEDDVVKAGGRFGSPSSAANASNAAISTVHAPDRLSSMLDSAESGSSPR